MTETIITQLLNTAFQIAILALITFGLAIVMGLLRILNMAHGEFLAIGAYVGFYVQSAGYSYVLAIPAAFVVSAAVGFVLERTVIRFLYDRPFDSLLATWGVAIGLREILEILFGKNYKSLTVPAPGTVDILGATYPIYRLVVLATIVIAFGLIAVWYRRSRTANQIKAMMINPELAGTVGINVERLATIAFVVGVGSAGVAGGLIAPMVRVDPLMGFDYLLDSFFALVVGGLGSFLGLFVGAGFIAGIQNAVSFATNQSYGYFTVLLLSILFMWRRPSGIVSSK